MPNAISSSSSSYGGQAASPAIGVHTTPMLVVSRSGVLRMALRIRSTRALASGAAKLSATRNSLSVMWATTASRRVVSRIARPAAMRAEVACAGASNAKLSRLTTTITRWRSSTRLREAMNVPAAS